MLSACIALRVMAHLPSRTAAASIALRWSTLLIIAVAVALTVSQLAFSDLLRHRHHDGRHGIVLLPEATSSDASIAVADVHHPSAVTTESWLHTALEAKFLASCGATVSASLAATQTGRLHCTGSNGSLSMYCFARDVCVSAMSGVYFPQIADEADADAGDGGHPRSGPSLLMHGGYTGYCGPQRRAIPYASHAAGSHIVQHGPTLVVELCECSHYAHGIATNAYGVFVQALRLATAIAHAAGSPNDGQPLLLSTPLHIVALAMHGTVGPGPGEMLGEPPYGMLESLLSFEGHSVGRFFVPQLRDPPVGEAHCYTGGAIIGLGHTCAQPPSVCTRGISPQLHRMYQGYVVAFADAHLQGTAGLQPRLPTTLAHSDDWFPTRSVADVPLFIVVQRARSRTIANVQEVIRMLEAFHARTASAACDALRDATEVHADAARVRTLLRLAGPTPHDAATLMHASSPDAPPARADERVLALLLHEQLRCDGAPRWIKSVLRWAVVSLEDATMQQQVRLFSRTHILASVRGNSNTNIAWLPLEASLVDLCPLGWEDTYWDSIIPMAQLRHTDMRCVTNECLPSRPAAELVVAKDRNLTVAPDALYAVLVREVTAQLTAGLRRRALQERLVNEWSPECL